MPGYFTDYLNNKVLDLVLGNSAFVSPSTLYIGLSLNPSSKGGVINEPSPSTGYLRMGVANTLLNFPQASNGSKTNVNTITFPTPTASWGTILAVFLADSANGGNILAMADLSSPRLVSLGSPGPTIASNALFLSHT